MRTAMMMGTALLLAGAAAAQDGGTLDRNGRADRNGGSGISTRQAIDAAILSDISRRRQADRDARRMPYESGDRGGSIGTARQARVACGAEALGEFDARARLAGAPRASTMATGWEVEGAVLPAPGAAPVPFVCSVRNGTVTGLALK